MYLWAPVFRPVNDQGRLERPGVSSLVIAAKRHRPISSVLSCMRAPYNPTIGLCLNRLLAYNRVLGRRDLASL